MLEWIKQIFILDTKVSEKRNIFRLCSSSWDDVYRIGEYLYKDSEIYLSRKKDLFAEFSALYLRKKVNESGENGET